MDVFVKGYTDIFGILRGFTFKKQSVTVSIHSHILKINQHTINKQKN